nr:OmpA family protein [uncultured Cohaesibacter sp.]
MAVDRARYSLHSIWFFGFLLTSPAHAQSTITLDSLGDDWSSESRSVAPKPTNSATDKLEGCLLDGAQCEDGTSRASSKISLEDVVNIGVIDHEEAAAIKSKSSKDTGQAATAALPSIDMEILFDYNASTIRADQYVKLAQLANTLSGERFKAFRFMFLGHTDAKGSREYNMALSSKRAQAVADFVRQSGGFQSNKMLVTGAGFSRLKDESDPYGAQNRRVQLVLIPNKD